MSRGEAVTVVVGDEAVDGTLLSAKSDGGGAGRTGPVPDGGTTEGAEPVTTAAPTTDGGEGRVTVGVPRRDAETLLAADRGRVLVRSRGVHRELELLGLLRRGGKRIARVSVRAGGELDGTTLGAASVRETYDVAVLAVRRNPETDHGRGWVFSPQGETELSASDELFAVGGRSALERFREAVA
jgi:hypothetical protein